MEPFSPNWWRTTSLQASQSSSIIDTALELLGMTELVHELPQSCSCPSLHTALTVPWFVSAAWLDLPLYTLQRQIHLQPVKDSELQLIRILCAAVCTNSVLYPLQASTPPPTCQLTGSDGTCRTNTDFVAKLPSIFSSFFPISSITSLIFSHVWAGQAQDALFPHPSWARSAWSEPRYLLPVARLRNFFFLDFCLCCKWYEFLYHHCKLPSCV